MAEKIGKSSRIDSWISSLPAGAPSEFTMAEILIGTDEKNDYGTITAIRIELLKKGWRRKKKRVAGVVVTLWEQPRSQVKPLRTSV